MAWRAARADDAREVQTGAKQRCSCRNGSLRRAKARQVRSKTISLSSVFRSEVLEVKSHNHIVQSLCTCPILFICAVTVVVHSRRACAQVLEALCGPGVPADSVVLLQNVQLRSQAEHDQKSNGTATSPKSSSSSSSSSPLHDVRLRVVGAHDVASIVAVQLASNAHTREELGCALRCVLKSVTPTDGPSPAANFLINVLHLVCEEIDYAFCSSGGSGSSSSSSSSSSRALLLLQPKVGGGSDGDGSSGSGNDNSDGKGASPRSQTSSPSASIERSRATQSAAIRTITHVALEYLHFKSLSPTGMRQDYNIFVAGEIAEALLRLPLRLRSELLSQNVVGSRYVFCA